MNGDTRKQTDCLYFLRGFCGKGESCPFKHDEQKRLELQTAKQNPDYTQICRFYAVDPASCARGAACRYVHDLSTTAKEQVKAEENQENSKAQASGEAPASTVVTRPSIFESTKIDEKVKSDPVLSSVRSSLRSRLSAPPEAAAAPGGTKPAPAVGTRAKQPVKPLTCVVKITRDGIVKQRVTPVGSQIPKGGQAKQSAPLFITQPAREQAKEQPKELKRPKSIDEIRREKRLKIASGKPVEADAPKSAPTVEQKAEESKDLIAPAKSAGMKVEIEKQESKLKSKKTQDIVAPEKKMEASETTQAPKESKKATSPPAGAALKEKPSLSTEMMVQDDGLLDADLEDEKLRQLEKELESGQPATNDVDLDSDEDFEAKMRALEENL